MERDRFHHFWKGKSSIKVIPSTLENFLLNSRDISIRKHHNKKRFKKNIKKKIERNLLGKVNSILNCKDH